MKILTKAKALLKKQHPRARFIYAVTAGAYLGELLVYMDTHNNNYDFLTLPNMSIRQVPTDKFDMGIKNNIVEVVEKLPTFVYDTCIMQYKKNKSSNSDN
jgi:hypothetical protein